MRHSFQQHLGWQQEGWHDGHDGHSSQTGTLRHFLTHTCSGTQTFTFRFTSPEVFVADYRRWYGPTVKAFEALGEDGRAALAADLAGLARRWDRNHGGSIAIPATYLESVLTLR